jgi:predicted dehydrogenase
VGYQWRALSFLPELRELLAGQAVGLVAARGIGPTRGRDWFVHGADGGGQVLERTSHFLDLARVLGGEVDWVAAAGAQVPLAGDDRPAQSDIDDVLAVTLGLAGGGLGTVDQAWSRRGLGERHAIDVVAEDARLELDLDPVFAVGGAARGQELALQAERPALEASLAAFLDAVAAGAPDHVRCSPGEALATLRVALAVEAALASGARETV